MANYCDYKCIVKGPKNACYAVFGSMSAYDDKWIAEESGDDENYCMRFEGNCKWSVDSYCEEREDLTPFEIPSDPKEAFEFGQNNWGILQRQKPVLFGVEFMCNSADTDDYDPDEYDKCGGYYEHYDIKGNEVKDECPKELYIEVESDYDDYDEEYEEDDYVVEEFEKEGNTLVAYNGREIDVVIPDGIEVIGESAFQNKDFIKTVTIPNSVKRIEDCAFFDCVKLEKLNLPDHEIYFDNSSLTGCKSLADEKGFVIISNILFGYFGNDIEVKIPNSVTEIGFKAFSYNESLKKIIIGNNVSEISSSAFYRCSSLEAVELPDSIKEINKETFYLCESLLSVNIPDSVEIIHEGAFSGCASLKDIELPGSIRIIEHNAFASCSSLKKINIPDSVEEIGFSVFMGCNSLADKDGFVIINNKLFDYVGPDENVIIPNGVNEIRLLAFCWNSNIKTVTIPYSVEKIGESAFAECENLKKVFLSQKLKKYTKNAFEKGVKFIYS